MRHRQIGGLRRVLFSFAVGVALTLGARVAPEDVPAPTLLENLKREFAALMQERGALQCRNRESMSLLGAAHGAEEEPRFTRTDTARAYRDAIMATEKALDEHPRVRELQARHDAIQAERGEVARGQAEVLDQWRATREDQRKQFEAEMGAALERAEKARQEILDRHGVKEAKDLSEDGLKRFREIRTRATNEIALIREAYEKRSSPEGVRAAREADGSAERFEEANRLSEGFDRLQEEIRSEMIRLRAGLRERDQTVAKLHRAAQAASLKHVDAIENTPDIAKARQIVAEADKLRAEIDRRARALRKRILAVDPKYRAELDKQAISGGLASKDETFWQLTD